MIVLRFYFLALTAILCIDLTAREIYVSPRGDDRNSGTKEQPLASLSGARDLLRQLRAKKNLKEEVRIIVEEGTYWMKEPLILNEFDSGSKDAPVTFMAEEGANPVFLGGIQIGNWEKVTDHLWKTNIKEVKHYGWYFEQLYVNGKRAIRARSPNQGFYFLREVSEIIIDKGEGRIANMAVQKLGLFPNGSSCLAKFTKTDFDDAVFTFYHKWDITRKRISGFHKDSSFIFTLGTGMQPWNQLDGETRYTIENYRAALDTCGEWYLDRSGELFYIPCDGETLENFYVIAPVTDKFIVLEGNPSTGQNVEYIRFVGLRFEVSGYQMPLHGNEAMQAAAPIEAVVMADFARNIEFVNCEIAHTGTNAIWFRKACSGCDVTHCYFHDLGAGGIKIGETQIPSRDEDLTRNIRIDNNIIRSGGYVFPCAVGITIFNASDNIVTHNEIADFCYSGVSVGWVWGYSYSPSKRNRIEFNHIHHLGWGELCDMGGVYCLGEAQGTTVSNNVIHHVYSFDYGGWGLYTDEGSTGVIMENNLVYACKNSGFHQHYGKDNIIRNNIFAANIKGQLQATRVEDHLSFTFTNNIIWLNSGDLLVSAWPQVNIKSDKNCYWDARTHDIRFGKQSFAEWQKAGKDIHSIIADPGFIDPENFDFRLKILSVARKIGFVPFDYSQAGVYGSDEWKSLAKFDKKRELLYDQTIAKLN